MSVESLRPALSAVSMLAKPAPAERREPSSFSRMLDDEPKPAVTPERTDPIKASRPPAAEKRDAAPAAEAPKRAPAAEAGPAEAEATGPDNTAKIEATADAEMAEVVKAVETALSDQGSEEAGVEAEAAPLAIGIPVVAVAPVTIPAAAAPETPPAIVELPEAAIMAAAVEAAKGDKAAQASPISVNVPISPDLAAASAAPAGTAVLPVAEAEAELPAADPEMAKAALEFVQSEGKPAAAPALNPLGDRPQGQPSGQAAAPLPIVLPDAAKTALAATAETSILLPQQAKREAAEAVASLRALPLEIGMSALRGMKQFTIRLDPAELGKVEVKLSMDDEGKVQAKLTADRVDTLYLLQRDARTLERAFDQAGLKTSPDSLDFSLRDNGADQRRHGETSREAQSSSRDALPMQDAETIFAQADLSQIRRIASAARGGVDLAI
jgi:flagellar hook-length control protein FliK